MACDTCGNKLTDAQIARYAAQLDSDPQWQTIMTAVAIAESGGCTSCYNGTCCTGLWQVHKMHAGKLGSPTGEAEFRQWLRNPDNNTKVAAQIYGSEGPEAWEAYTNQSYRDFIERARKVTGVSGPSGLDIAAAGIDATSGLPFANPFAAAADVVGALNQMLNVIGDAARWISDRDNWTRVLQVGGGVALALVAASIVAKPIISSTAKTVSPI